MTEVKQFELKDIPKLPEYGSKSLSAEVGIHLNVAIDTIEHALAALQQAAPKDIDDQLRTIRVLRLKVAEKNESWHQRLTSIRALNQRINMFEQSANEVDAMRPPKGTLRVKGGIFRAMLGAAGIASLDPIDHDAAHLAADFGVNLNMREVRSLRAERDALGDVPLKEHTDAMDWIVAKLDEVSEILRSAINQNSVRSV